MPDLAKYAKAIVAALVPAVVMYLTFRSDGVTADEWEAIGMTVLAGFGFTWAVPNAVAKTPASQAIVAALANRPKAAGGIVSAGQPYIVGEGSPQTGVPPTQS